MSSELPVRRHPAHPAPVRRINTPTIVFLTACVAHRQPMLASGEMHAHLVGSWRQADAWAVGRYVILPDHVHLFCAPDRRTRSLEDWVRYWKWLVCRRTGLQALWQTGFWDTQLRRSESYEAKWEYVQLNPVRHGLVGDARDWPYAGELNVLEW